MAAIEDSGGEELFFVQLGQVKKAKLGHVWLKSQFHWYIMMKHAGASLEHVRSGRLAACLYAAMRECRRRAAFMLRRLRHIPKELKQQMQYPKRLLCGASQQL